MNVKPTSDEAKKAVWTAYEALDEKLKRAIAKGHGLGPDLGRVSP